MGRVLRRQGRHRAARLDVLQFEGRRFQAATGSRDCERQPNRILKGSAGIEFRRCATVGAGATETEILNLI